MEQFESWLIPVFNLIIGAIFWKHIAAAVGLGHFRIYALNVDTDGKLFYHTKYRWYIQAIRVANKLSVDYLPHGAEYIPLWRNLDEED